MGGSYRTGDDLEVSFRGTVIGADGDRLMIRAAEGGAVWSVLVTETGRIVPGSTVTREEAPDAAE